MTDILQEASELINGQRAKDYGDVTENFQRIANLWTDYLGPDDWQFSTHDVAMMMILVKMSRLATGGYHRDSLVDIAGYAALDEKLWVAIVAREAEVEAGYEKLARHLAEESRLPQEFWDDIDTSIVEAQQKRERDTTSKPPRVWGSFSEVPLEVKVFDKDGEMWHGEGSLQSDLDDRFGPFTEILDIERKGSE